MVMIRTKIERFFFYIVICGCSSSSWLVLKFVRWQGNNNSNSIEKVVHEELLMSSAKKTIRSNGNHHHHHREAELNFIPSYKLEKKDYYSGSFFLGMETFRNKLNNIRRLVTCESVFLEAIDYDNYGGDDDNKKKNKNKKRQSSSSSRMMVDWTDFSVLHWSHWWKKLNLLSSDMDPSIFSSVEKMIQENIDSVTSTAPMYRNTTNFQRAIAIIPFQSYKRPIEDRSYYYSSHPRSTDNSSNNSSNNNNNNNMDDDDEVKAERLTALTVASTIASLCKISFGRIVVVGYRPGDQTIAEEAIQIVTTAFYKKYGTATMIMDETTTKSATTKESPSSSLKLVTELAYARIRDMSFVRDYRRKNLINMQRGCVISLQRCLKGQMDAAVTAEWLGSSKTSSSPDYWQYVYLSEQDLLLQTKPWVLPSIKKGLDEGLGFFPHRLQPLPHESDLPPALTKNETMRRMFLPDTILPFSNVTFLDPLNGNDSCCDDHGDVEQEQQEQRQKGIVTTYWPGRMLVPKRSQYPCNDWWWACGFNPKKDGIIINYTDPDQIRDIHKPLLPYPMIRLKNSMLVFGPTEQGRRCLPSRTPCRSSTSKSTAPNTATSS